MNRVVWLINTFRLRGIEFGRSEADNSFVIKRNQPYGRLAKSLLEMHLRVASRYPQGGGRCWVLPRHWLSADSAVATWRPGNWSPSRSNAVSSASRCTRSPPASRSKHGSMITLWRRPSACLSTNPPKIAATRSAAFYWLLMGRRKLGS